MDAAASTTATGTAWRRAPASPPASASLQAQQSSHCQERYGVLTECDLSEYFECVAAAYYCDGEFLDVDVDVDLANACAALSECG